MVVCSMNKEIELIRTSDCSYKDKIIKIFVKERISYLQKSKYVTIFNRCMTGNKEIYVIYVDINQYEQANRILKSLIS